MDILSVVVVVWAIVVFLMLATINEIKKRGKAKRKRELFLLWINYCPDISQCPDREACAIEIEWNMGMER